MKSKRIIGSILLCTMLGYATPVFALTKEETVYSKLNNSGTQYETIVNEHIKNDELLKTIDDISNLLDITNVGGNETFEQKENKIIWNANEKDIYYQGKTEKKLPIETSIKYELDGKEMSAEEIVGKRGKVKITITYKNNETHNVNINGTTEKMYTPFIVITGTTLDTKTNKNIKLTQGKVVEKGEKTILLGVAFPGLKESLKTNEIDIPNKVEISMETEKFELENMITYITPRVLEDNKLKVTDKLNELYSSMNDMKLASEKLENGSKTLQEGTSQYAEKSQEFTGYMNKLTQGTESANAGATQVAAGANTLATKSSALIPGVSTLSDGAKTLKEKVNYMAESSQALAAGATSINTGITNTSKAIDAMNATLSTVDVKAKIANLTTLVNTDKALKTNLENMQTALTAQKDSTTDDHLKANLTSQIEMNEKTIKLLEQNISANEQSIELLKSVGKAQITVVAIKEGLDGKGTKEEPGLKVGANSLDKNLTALAKGLDTMNTKSDELVAGTSELSTKSEALIEGISTLKTGANKLNAGTNALNASVKELYSASKQLAEKSGDIAEGAKELSEGIKEFNTKAINKLYSTVNGDIHNLTSRIDALEKLSKEYMNFAEMDEEMNGNVKFILITDPLKQNEEKTNN